VIVVAGMTAGAIDVVDPRTMTRTASIPVGSSPVQVAVAPDGATAYVSLAGSSSVAKVDLARQEVVRTVTVPAPPVQLYLSTDGSRLLSADQGTPDAPGDSVSVIDPASMTVTATITTGSGPHGVVIEPSGRVAWVTNLYDDTVSVIDLTTNTTTATIPVGDMPNGISFTPAVATPRETADALDIPDYAAAADETDSAHAHGGHDD